MEERRPPPQQTTSVILNHISKISSSLHTTQRLTFRSKGFGAAAGGAKAGAAAGGAGAAKGAGGLGKSRFFILILHSLAHILRQNQHNAFNKSQLLSPK